jgi:hypothetical protein
VIPSGVKIMRLLLFSMLVLGLAGQPPQNRDAASDPAKRLAIMKNSMAASEVRGGESGADSYRLKPEPVLRFTNTVGDSRDGSIFLWLGDADRPKAAVQVFQTRGGWLQEWTSLSTTPLIAKMADPPDWRPTRGGIEFKPVAGAPKPADGANERLRQMHMLTRDFTARDQFRGTWQPLRLMPKPLARYGKPGSEVVDGALFAYVITTDPEVLLMLEARQSKDGMEWQYAFAPMSTYALEGSWKEQVVWSLDSSYPTSSGSTFFQRSFEPRE